MTNLTRNLRFTEVDQLAALRLIDAAGGQVDLVGTHQPLPAGLTHIVEEVISVVAAGGSVTVGMLRQELTTTAAADILGVSRPTLMKMVARGEVAAHKVGSHHRLRRDDVIAAKKARLTRQHLAFEELRSLEDELDQS